MRHCPRLINLKGCFVAKVRLHREWFRTVSLGGRKSCPSCSAKLNGQSVWSWGEYVTWKWRTVKHFCPACFPPIRRDLVNHTAGCGCEIELVGYGGERLPEWLTLNCPVEA